ncbi:Type III secretion inner membrane protein [Candidatus Rhodobacter oscarellae]|uniref:Type III secretion inner membrane protein n=1 Tax=Candidatus Rhodobacter oscarellae TaxID=1675527 RepID=A0A0J9E122_9RHOB|nr:type III secretion system export apparatus subunit SctS [Candidatus Rhodobacter lobularis]KMW56382.1 Type III secretion inner membrane protein [Candidatus Rhodobacter lobularis]
MITDKALEAILLVMWLSLPAIAAATLVGLLIGLFQALTQIQDQTLPHGVKLVVVTISLVGTGYLLGGLLMRFTVDAFDGISRLN